MNFIFFAESHKSNKYNGIMFSQVSVGQHCCNGLPQNNMTFVKLLIENVSTWASLSVPYLYFFHVIAEINSVR